MKRKNAKFQDRVRAAQNIRATSVFTDHLESPIEVRLEKPFSESCSCLADKLFHAAPPINEIGLSVSTITGGVIDPYDVKSFHQSFPELPLFERQGTIGNLDLATQVGGGSNVIDFSKGPPQKWWFVSADQSRVFQAQDNFVSYNWRRFELSPGSPIDYPGFDQVLSEFKSSLALAQKWHTDNGSELPSPAGCELFYDNIIPMISEDGQPLSMSDVLVEFNRAESGRPALGWVNQWMEEIDALEDGDQSVLRVHIAVLGLALPDRDVPLPVVKLMFTAGAARSTWNDVIQFFEIAHDHVRKRFLTLIDRKVQSTWN